MEAFQQISEKNTNFGYLLAFVSSALFGSISTLAKPAVETVNPLLLAAFVSIIAAIVFTSSALRSKTSLTKKNLSLITIIAMLGTVFAPTLYFIGLKTTTASNATILSNSEIIFTVIIALLIFRERVGKRSFISVGLVFTGIFLIALNFKLESIFDFQNVGNWLIVATMLCWAFDNNISKFITKSVDVSRIIQLKSLIGGVILFSLVYAFQLPITIEISNLTNVIFLGVFGLALPLFLFYHALKRIGTIKTILIFSTSPIFGVIYASIFLNEVLMTYQIVAMFLMIGGIFLLGKDKFTIKKVL